MFPRALQKNIHDPVIECQTIKEFIEPSDYTECVTVILGDISATFDHNLLWHHSSLE